ncbi:MAG: helix-turn-helix transcriptional regulator [Bacilli bacterium]|jgi:transcriptional regulator with XRE-family HTH domain|nr:helix-turn-helix transcriptional regulator [Bacilli bacterium]MCX4253758.1 helix-turn-helix transcriptional regulator [Bacilli bacterium]
MSIGEKIYSLRKSKNMSQEDLANVLNVSRQTVSKWETGESNPDIEKIVPLCDFFDISTDELLKGSNSYLEREIVLEKKRNKALTMSLCIVIFVVMMIIMMIFDEIGVSDSLMATIILIGLGSISIILVYYFTAQPVNNRKIKLGMNLEKRKLINSIVNMLTVIIYFLVSFLFQAWAVSWIILIIGALIKRIIELVDILRREENE